MVAHQWLLLNASPVYAVNNASNGVVTLNGDGHTAHFTPALNFFGLASFQYAVTANDGSGYTNISARARPFPSRKP